MHNYCPPLSPTTRALHFFQCVIIAPLFLFGEFPYNYVHQLNKKNPLKSHLSGFGANKPNPPPKKKKGRNKNHHHHHLHLGPAKKKTPSIFCISTCTAISRESDWRRANSATRWPQNSTRLGASVEVGRLAQQKPRKKPGERRNL